MARMLTEATTTALQAAGGRRYRVRVIEGPRWGSSGFHTTEALDGAVNVLRPGTKVYIDHPSATEDRDRPERSLRDLAAKIGGPITREADGVYATMEPLPHWADTVASLASTGDLDMSIRALAEFHPGEAEGRHGVIIDRYTEFLSVDLVTEAGAGGRVMELIESARAVEASANDRREQLRAALAAAYATTDDDYVWVRDFDPDRGLVWFEQNDHLWQQAYAAADTGITLTGEPIEVVAVTTYHPVNAAGETQQETSMPQIDEAEHKRLTEAAAKVGQLEAELAQATERATAAEAERDEARTAAEASRAAAAEAAITASTLPEKAKDRVREALKANPAADVAEAIKAEADYLAAVAPTRPGVFGTTSTAESVTKPARSPWGREIKGA